VTPETFKEWISDMKALELARSDADCARLLDISFNSLVIMKRRGANQRTDLACHAILMEIGSYTQSLADEI